MNVVALLLLIVLLGMPNFVRAQPYVEAKLGYASADFALDEPYNGSVDDTSITYGLTVGLGLGTRWGVELGLNGYGDFEGRATPCPIGTVCAQVVSDVDGIDMRVWNLALVPRFEVGPVQAFAKAGFYHADIDTSIGLPNDEFNENGLLLGAGLRWYFDDPWSVSLEATRHDSNFYQLSLGFGWGMRLLSPTS